MRTKFSSENMEENATQDLGIDGRITLGWILGKWGVDWIHLAQDGKQWRALVNTIIYLRGGGLY